MFKITVPQFCFNLNWTSKNNPFHVWLKKYLYISNSLKQSQICKKLLTHQHQKWKKKKKKWDLYSIRESYCVLTQCSISDILIWKIAISRNLNLLLKSIENLYNYGLPMKFWAFIWYIQKCWQFLSVYTFEKLFQYSKKNVSLKTIYSTKHDFVYP